MGGQLNKLWYSSDGEVLQKLKELGQSLHLTITICLRLSEKEKNTLKNDMHGVILFIFLNHKTVLHFQYCSLYLIIYAKIWKDKYQR
jgi:hypothetical protein